MGYAWIFAAIAALVLLYRDKAYAAWVGPGAFLLLAGWLAGCAPVLTTLVFVAAAVVFRAGELRKGLITPWLMPAVARMLPRMGETERVALEAGTVWWDGELFSGAPDWDRLFSFRPAALSREERAFLDGPVEDLCAQLTSGRSVRTATCPTQSGRESGSSASSE